MAGDLITTLSYNRTVVERKAGVNVEGDFEPIVDEHTFHRAQLAMRKAASTGEQRFRNNPDFPLRRFVRCGSCDSPLTGSWARSKTGKRYAYYHSHRCRSTSLLREVLEERFLELLDRLKSTKKKLQALKESVLVVWRKRKRDLEEARPHMEKEIARFEEQKKRLVAAYVYEQAIDQDTYRRELARISQDLTLVRRGVSNPGNLPVLQGLEAAGDGAGTVASPLRSELEPRCGICS